MSIMIEEWKDIPGYEGLYQVSNMGNIKSLKFNRERLLKPFLNNNGYLRISLFINNNVKKYYMHQLVAMAFLDHKPDGFKLLISHKNHDKLDNNLNNLFIATNRENCSDYRTDVGVHWCKQTNKWRSEIVINNKRIFLGRFNHKEDALDAYQKSLNV